MCVEGLLVEVFIQTVVKRGGRLEAHLICRDMACALALGKYADVRATYIEQLVIHQTYTIPGYLEV